MNRARLIAVIVGLSALIAWLDYWTSAELLGSVLFVLPLVLCIPEGSRWLLWGTASTATLLTAATAVWSFHRIALLNPWVASLNRALLILSLLTFSTLIHLWMNRSQRIMQAIAELEQQRDQMTARNTLLENELIKLKTAAKGRRKPQLLTVKQYQAFLAQLSDLHRTMVIAAMCSGVRISELLSLRWDQVDFAAGEICGQKGFANGRSSEGKIDGAAEKILMDPVLAEALQDWRSKNPGSGLVFPSHITGRCYHAGPIQQDYFRPAARKLGLYGVCWHTFHDSYRSWLNEAGGASRAIQQKLMRHPDISTVMNVGTNGTMKSKAKGKREPQSKIGRRTLPTVGFRAGVSNVVQSTHDAQSG